MLACGIRRLCEASNPYFLVTSFYVTSVKLCIQWWGCWHLPWRRLHKTVIFTNYGLQHPKKTTCSTRQGNMSSIPQFNSLGLMLCRLNRLGRNVPDGPWGTHLPPQRLGCVPLASYPSALIGLPLPHTQLLFFFVGMIDDCVFLKCFVLTRTLHLEQLGLCMACCSLHRRRHAQATVTLGKKSGVILGHWI